MTTSAEVGGRWTVAFRKPRANRFLRVSGLNLIWDDAVWLSHRLESMVPGLQVWFVQAASDDQTDPAIRTDSGKMVRVVETGAKVHPVTAAAFDLWLDELNRRIREWGGVGDTLQELIELMRQRTEVEQQTGRIPA